MTDPLSKTGDRSKDLCIGEPGFLQRWKRKAKAKGAVITLDEEPDECVDWPGYPPFKGHPLLLKRLAQLSDISYRHYVVTTGAKQGLYAAVHAMLRNKPRAIAIHHPAPYWPTYPTIASQMRFAFERRAPVHDNFLPLEISIQTIPNNPDGGQIGNAPFNDVDIWDGAYAHAIYGWNGLPPQHQLGVFSAAKLLGCSDLRVGWIGTDDDGLAHDAAAYVEAHTSGVSVADQLYVADVLTQVGLPDHLACRDILLRNVEAFNVYLGKHVEDVHGSPGPEAAGMFAWFRPKNAFAFKRALDVTQIQVLDGKHCGSAGYYRMNLGREVDRTWPLLAQLEKELR